MAILLEVPVEDGAVLLVEADRGDIPQGLTLASPKPGEAAAKAARSLSESLEQLEPMLRTVKDRLVASAPDHFTCGVRGEAGRRERYHPGKGTTEVNLKITMVWNRG